MRLPWRSKQRDPNNYQTLDLPLGYDMSTTRSGDDHPLVFAVVDWLASNARQVRPVTTPLTHPARDLITPDLLEDMLALLLLEGRVLVRAHRSPVRFPIRLEPIPLARLSQQNGEIFVDRVRLSPNDMFMVRLRNDKSPLRVLAADLLTEDECVSVVNALLKNRGILGLVVSPEAGQPPWPPDVTEQVRSDVHTRTSGKQRGSTLAIGAPINVESQNASGIYDALAALRNIPQELVSAVFHVPAAVVGFGSGMEQTAVGATLLELRAIAWQDGLLPHVDRLYSGLNNFLAGPNGFNSPGLNLEYSTRTVGAFADRWRKDALAWQGLVLAGIADPATAAMALGLDEVR